MSAPVFSCALTSVGWTVRMRYLHLPDLFMRLCTDGSLEYATGARQRLQDDPCAAHDYHWKWEGTLQRMGIKVLTRAPRLDLVTDQSPTQGEHA